MPKLDPAAASLVWRLLPDSAKQIASVLEALLRVPSILVEMGERLEALEQLAAGDRKVSRP